MLQVTDRIMVKSSQSGHMPPRITVGVAVFILCCLLSSFRLIWNAPNPARVREDDIAARSDQRFAALKTHLPDRGVIGYVGQFGNSGTADYYLAQYALAPLVVDHSVNHSLVIGNFPRSSPEFSANLRLIRDFGNGVLLLSNKDAR